jgi:hypothetical protein
MVVIQLILPEYNVVLIIKYTIAIPIYLTILNDPPSKFHNV